MLFRCAMYSNRFLFECVIFSSYLSILNKKAYFLVVVNHNNYNIGLTYQY